MDFDWKRLMEAKENPGDYIGADGLLYCGKCHSPKQARLAVNPATGKAPGVTVGIACQCQEATARTQEQKAERERFQQAMATRREDNISSPGGLRYTFAQDDRQQANISDACLRYVEDWDTMLTNGIGILFYGTVGTGKSFFASCIGNALLERLVSVVSTNFPRLLNLLQGTQDKQKLLDRLSVYKLLIIDDLGVERDSSYAAEQIYNVIDARKCSGLPLIVTTNLTLDELEHPVSMQYVRIYDRVLEMCPIRIKLTGESRRKRNAEERLQLARKIILGDERADK